MAKRKIIKYGQPGYVRPPYTDLKSTEIRIGRVAATLVQMGSVNVLQHMIKAGKVAALARRTMYGIDKKLKNQTCAMERARKHTQKMLDRSGAMKICVFREKYSSTRFSSYSWGVSRHAGEAFIDIRGGRAERIRIQVAPAWGYGTYKRLYEGATQTDLKQRVFVFGSSLFKREANYDIYSVKYIDTTARTLNLYACYRDGSYPLPMLDGYAAKINSLKSRRVVVGRTLEEVVKRMEKHICGRVDAIVLGKGKKK